LIVSDSSTAIRKIIEINQENQVLRETGLVVTMNTSSKYKIVIDRHNHLLYLTDHTNTVLSRYPVGIGRESSPTPTGVFRVVNIVTNPRSFRSEVLDAVFGSVWIGLSEPHYGIHGTDKPESIGTNLTDGCIRMSNDDVNQLSRFIKIGTPVYIY